jgi:cephalosporin hydroxylase
MTDPLSELCLLYDSDKGPTSPKRVGHNYTPAYHAILGPHRDEVRKVLEIGVWFGASLKMWEGYFPNAQVYGIEKEPQPELATRLLEFPRIHVIVGDASLPATRDVLIAGSGPEPFDLIVDDGSHIGAEVMKNFDLYFPLVRRGCPYIIEDCKPHTTGDAFWVCWKQDEAAEFDIGAPLGGRVK